MRTAFSAAAVFFRYSTRAHDDTDKDSESETSKGQRLLAKLGRCKSCKTKPLVQLKGSSRAIEPPERALSILSASLGKRLDPKEAAAKSYFCLERHISRYETRPHGLDVCCGG
jgi:hypothetical protein